MYKIGIQSYLSCLTEVLLFNRKRFNKCLMLIYLIAAKHIVYQVQCEEY